MKPPPFKYYDPTTQDEVVGLLGSLENAKLLAGGQSLMPMLNMRFVLPDHVVDLNRVAGLDFIRAESGGLRVGAMTRPSRRNNSSWKMSRNRESALLVAGCPIDRRSAARLTERSA